MLLALGILLVIYFFFGGGGVVELGPRLQND